MFDKIIFHIDVNSAFLSWEAVYRREILHVKEDLRDIPSAVGGDVRLRHGIILAKSQPAKKYGVQTGETLMEARRKCPSLKLVPPHYRLYDRCSAALMEILRRFSPNVEQYSIDEAYCDMSGTAGLYGFPMVAAHLIKDTVRQELGFTVNVGISSNKLLAKMASDFRKPDQVHTLFPEEIPQKMWPLPVSELFFVGHATAKKLFALGIRTIGDLARTDPGVLRTHLKKQGELIYAFANGVDVSQVVSAPPANKGYGNSMTTPKDVTDLSEARLVLLALCETIGSRLRKDGASVGVVSVSIVYSDFTGGSHQTTLPEETDLTDELWEHAVRLFEELWDGRPARHLGVHTGKVVYGKDTRQMNLFTGERPQKLQRLGRTLDELREKYGEDCIMRGVFLNGQICHMSGGIGREKQTVDYEKELKKVR